MSRLKFHKTGVCEEYQYAKPKDVERWSAAARVALDLLKSLAKNSQTKILSYNR